MQSKFNHQNVKSLQNKFYRNTNKNQDEHLIDDQSKLTTNHRYLQKHYFVTNQIQVKSQNSQQNNRQKLDQLNFQFDNCLQLSNQVFTTKNSHKETLLPIQTIQTKKQSPDKPTHQVKNIQYAQQLILTLKLLKNNFSKCPLYRTIDLLYKKYNIQVDPQQIFLIDPDAERRKCKIDLQVQVKKGFKKYNRIKRRSKFNIQITNSQIKNEDASNQNQIYKASDTQELKEQHNSQNNQQISHQNHHEDQNISVSITEKSQKSNNQSPSNLQISKKYLSLSNSFSNTRRKHNERKDHYNEKYKAERMIAKVYCMYGYGMEIARNNFGNNIDRNIYNNTISTMIRQSFRKLQDFLIKSCQNKMKVIKRQQYGLIKTQLIHCRKYFQMQEVKTFMKFIKHTYRIRTEQPSLQEASHLYQSILQKLEKKQQQKNNKKNIGQRISDANRDEQPEEQKFSQQIKHDL